MSNQNVRPKITWGASFVNTLTIAYPLDDWRSYSEQRGGSITLQVESGTEDAWDMGSDYVLEGSARWITSTGTNPSGWDGSTGWRAFLEWARLKNVFRFYPNADVNTYYSCYLVEPLNGQHTLEMDGTRSIRLVIRNPTSPFDGY